MLTLLERDACQRFSNPLKLLHSRALQNWVRGRSLRADAICKLSGTMAMHIAAPRICAHRNLSDSRVRPGPSRAADATAAAQGGGEGGRRKKVGVELAGGNFILVRSSRPVLMAAGAAAPSGT